MQVRPLVYQIVSVARQQWREFGIKFDGIYSVQLDISFVITGAFHLEGTTQYPAQTADGLSPGRHTVHTRAMTSYYSPHPTKSCWQIQITSVAIAAEAIYSCRYHSCNPSLCCCSCALTRFGGPKLIECRALALASKETRFQNEFQSFNAVLFFFFFAIQGRLFSLFITFLFYLTI